MKENKRTRSINHKRKDKESKSNTDSAAHNQTLKQQKQQNGRNHHIPINTNNECQHSTSPSKHTFGKLIKKEDCCLLETKHIDRNKHGQRVKG
jgi:hypothetical protein